MFSTRSILRPHALYCTLKERLRCGCKRRCAHRLDAVLGVLQGVAISKEIFSGQGSFDYKEANDETGKFGRPFQHSAHVDTHSVIIWLSYHAFAKRHGLGAGPDSLGGESRGRQLLRKLKVWEDSMVRALGHLCDILTSTWNRSWASNPQVVLHHVILRPLCL